MIIGCPWISLVILFNDHLSSLSFPPLGTICKFRFQEWIACCASCCYTSSRRVHFLPLGLNSTSINLLLPSLIRVIQHGASAFIEIISVLPINSVCSYVTYFPCSIFFFIRVDHAQCSFPNRDRHTIIAISSCHNKISPLSLWQPLSLCRQNDYCFIKLCGYLVNAFRVPSTHLLPFSWKDKTATCTVSFKLLFNISDLIDTFSFLPLFCLLSATFPYQRGTDRHFLVFKVEKIISF